LRKALDAFPAALPYRHVIVLFSDGENLSGSPFGAAVQAGQIHCPVYTIVVGTEEGGNIPLADGSFVRDPRDKTVISKADAGSLKRIAALSGGRLFRFTDGNILPRIAESIGGATVKGAVGAVRIVQIDRYRLFLSLALVFLLIHLGVRVVKWKNYF
jgi:Ca-activated chloride channel family protein